MNLVSLLVLLFTLCQFGFAQSNYGIPSKNESWLDGWTYRRPITVDNTSNPSGLITYQVFIESDSFNYDETKDDAADLRFTASDGQNLLSYWIEEWDTTGLSIVWVEVNLIPASSSTTIYMYYGCDTAAAVSDEDNTFPLADDFTRGYLGDEWTASGAGVPVTDITSVSTSLTNEPEGIAFDGTYYYVTTFDKNHSAAGHSWIWKLNADGTTADGPDEVSNQQEDSLTHAGGVCLADDGYIWTNLSYNTDPYDPPVKINRYDPSDLSFVNTVIEVEEPYTCAAVLVCDDIDRVYLWGDPWSANLRIYNRNGTFIHTYDFGYQTRIQDATYYNGLIFGSVNDAGSNTTVTVWKPVARAGQGTIGDSLQKVGQLITSSQRTSNGFCSYADTFYFCNEIQTPNRSVWKTLNQRQCVVNPGDKYVRSDATYSIPQILEYYNMMGDDGTPADNRKQNCGFASVWPVATSYILANHTGTGYIRVLESGGGASESNLYIEAGEWIRWRFTWFDDTAYLCKNRDADSTIYLYDATIPGSGLYAGLQTWGSADDSMNVAWAFLRDYTAIEPTIDIGAEEEEGGEPPEPGVDARNAMNRYGLATGWGIYRW